MMRSRKTETPEPRANITNDPPSSVGHAFMLWLWRWPRWLRMIMLPILVCCGIGLGVFNLLPESYRARVLDAAGADLIPQVGRLTESNRLEPEQLTPRAIEHVAGKQVEIFYSSPASNLVRCLSSDLEAGGATVHVNPGSPEQTSPVVAVERDGSITLARVELQPAAVYYRLANNRPASQAILRWFLDQGVGDKLKIEVEYPVGTAPKGERKDWDVLLWLK